MRGYRRLIKKSKSKKPSGVVYDYIVINTTSNSASWTPTSIVNTGNTLIWEVYDGNYSYGSLPSTPTYIYTETISNNPIFDFSSNTTGYTVVIKSTSGFSGLTALYLNTLSLTYLNVIEATSLTELSFKSNASLTSVDLSTLTSLEQLTFRSTGLTSISLTNNTSLTNIWGYSCPSLTAIDLSNQTSLSGVMYLYSCGITDLDGILADLAGNSITGVDIKITGNTGSLTSASATDYDTLITASCTIDVAKVVAGDTESPIVGTLTYANESYNSVELTCAATDNIAVTGFKIYNNVTEIDDAVGYANLSSYVLTGLTPETSYTQINIKAYDSSGNISDASNNVSFTTSASPTSAEGAPILSNFRIIDGETNADRIYFDSNEPITGTTITGFDLSDGLRKSITGITIIPSVTTGHYFTVDSDFDYWDTYAIRYEGGSNVQDVDTNALNEFWLTEVDNQISEPAPSGTAYWVRTTGSDSADGLSHATAFLTINKALSLNATTIYIEAGDYGAEQIEFTYNGTATNPIIVQGYKTYTSGTAPDPITSNYWSWGSYGTGTSVTVDTSELPTITGNTTLRRTTGETAIVPSNYIIIKNIQVTYWNRGFDITSKNHFVLKNIVTVYTGGDNSGVGAGIYVVGGSGSDADVHSKFIDIQIAQCAVVGLRLYGGGSLFDNVNINADSAFGVGYDTPDYYLSIYHGSNNVIKNCNIAEIGEDIGSSHGIGFKTGSTPHANCTEYNLVTDFVVRNMQGAIELRHEDVAHTVVRNGTIFSLPADGAISATGNGSVGLVVRDGSHHNKFENITIDSQYRAIYYTDTVEQGDQTNGHSCIFKNIVVSNCAIFLATNGKTSVTQAYDNEFYNITVDGIFDELYWSNGSIVIMDNTNTLTNSTFSNCTCTIGVLSSTSFIQSHNNYYNNSFATPSGTSITTHDPLFTDRLNGDFALQGTSNLIGIGTDTSNKYGLEGNERVSGSVDIGAYQT